MISNEQDVVNRAKKLFAQNTSQDMLTCIRKAVFDLANMAELSRCLAENDINIEEYIKYLHNKMFLGEI